MELDPYILSLNIEGREAAVTGFSVPTEDEDVFEGITEVFELLLLDVAGTDTTDGLRSPAANKSIFSDRRMLPLLGSFVLVLVLGVLFSGVENKLLVLVLVLYE